MPFTDLMNTARLLNDFLRNQLLEAGIDEKRDLGRDILEVIKRRLGEAKADDLGQIAWLALRLNEFAMARGFVKRGLELEPDNPYLLKLAKEPSISL